MGAKGKSHDRLLFDSAHGGITVSAPLSRLSACFHSLSRRPRQRPLRRRESDEIVALTFKGVDALFRRGCRLVLSGATPRLRRRPHLAEGLARGERLAGPQHLRDRRPTVEAATQTPWAVTTPQFPRVQHTNGCRVRHHQDHRPHVSRGDSQRCPPVTVVQQTCAELAGAIERGAPERELDRLVEQGVVALLAQTAGVPPHRAILGCTHYPLVEHLFRRHLPPFTRLLAQPRVVADSLEDYLQRHPRYVDAAAAPTPVLTTTGDPDRVNAIARIFWPDVPAFSHLPA